MNALLEIQSPRREVRVLTLRRPEKRNALNIAILEALCAEVDRASADGARVLILRGAGPVFCAGMDLDEAREAATAERSGDLIRRVLEAIYRAQAVTIAVVHGAALAGGAGIAAACDLVVAADEAKFGFPEVRRGLVAGLVMTFLRRQIGERHARWLLLTGESISAARAVEIGLATQAVPIDDLETAVDRAVSAALQAAPGAIQETKELLDHLWHHDIAGDLGLARAVHRQMRESEEAREGLAAFAEGRNPAWVPDGLV